VVGKDRINWQVDPPPDLVVEIDVTNYTDVEDYAAYNVPEVWLWKRGKLEIYGLQNREYKARSRSQYFPELEISAIAIDLVRKASDRGTGVAIASLQLKIKNLAPVSKARGL